MRGMGMCHRCEVVRGGWGRSDGGEMPEFLAFIAHFATATGEEIIATEESAVDREHLRRLLGSLSKLPIAPTSMKGGQ